MADGEPDSDGFWQSVATNLAATRLRLLFVADDIPDPLERVVEFLNAQMARIEVLAVEIKQFKGHSSQTLEPLAKLPGDWGWAQSSALLVNTIALDRRLDILSGEPAARRR